MRLTGRDWQGGQEKQIALAVADVFDDFFKGLTKISDAANKAEVTDAAG